MDVSTSACYLIAKLMRHPWQGQHPLSGSIACGITRHHILRQYGLILTEKG